MYKQAQEALQKRMEKVAISTGFINQRLLNAAEGLKKFSPKSFKGTGLGDKVKGWKASLKPKAVAAESVSINPASRAARNAEVRAQIAQLRKLRSEQATGAMAAVEGKPAQKAVLKKIQGAGFVHPKVKQDAVMDTLSRAAARSQQNASRAGLSATMKNPWVGRSAMIGGGLLGGGMIGSAMSSDPRADNGQYA